MGIDMYFQAMHTLITGCIIDLSAHAFSLSQDQKAQSMLTRILNSFFLRALSSPACGWVVRTVILSASGKASSCADAADGGAGKMVMIR